MLLANNSLPTKGINLSMDKLIADIKRVLEENDPTITVEESLPPTEPKDEARSKSNPDMPIKTIA